jgi:hypothetical protein
MEEKSLRLMSFVIENLDKIPQEKIDSIMMILWEFDNAFNFVNKEQHKKRTKDLTRHINIVCPKKDATNEFLWGCFLILYPDYFNEYIKKGIRWEYCKNMPEYKKEIV